MRSEEGAEQYSVLLRIRKALLLAGCLLTPLIAAPGILQDPFNLPKLALLTVVTIAAGSVALAEWLIKGRAIGGGSLVVPACAMTSPLVAAWVVSPYKEWALLGSYTRFLGVVPYVIFALFGLLLFDTFRGDATSLAWTICLSAALVGLYTFVQILGLDPVTWRAPDGEEISRQTSTIGNTNFLGGFLAISLPLSLAFWRSTGRRRLVAMTCTIFIAEGLLFSTSQGAWAAATAGCAITFGALAHDRRRRRAGVILAASIAGALLATPLIAAANPDSPIGGVSIIARGHLWTGAWQMGLERPLFGWGPNSFAVDGARFRDTSDVVAFGEVRPDDPHSVPAAFLANAGFTGLALWSLAMASLLSLAFRGVQRMPQMTAGFAGALVAYATQALVTIDVVTLRFGLWVCAAGLAADLTSRGTRVRDRGRTGFVVGAGVVCIVGMTGAAMWWVLQTVRYDARVAAAIQAFQQDDVKAGIEGFGDALMFRDEYGYRQLFSTELASAALVRGRDGDQLIERMDEVNAYLSHFPDPGHILARAQWLHYWGHYDPSADARAVAEFRRALQLDPANYLIRMPLSEALIDLGRAQEALEALEPAMSLQDAVPRLSAPYAIAALEAHDTETAARALESARKAEPTGCRTHIAEALFIAKVDREEVPDALEAQVFFSCDAGLFQFFLDHVGEAIN